MENSQYPSNKFIPPRRLLKIFIPAFIILSAIIVAVILNQESQEVLSKPVLRVSETAKQEVVLTIEMPDADQLRYSGELIDDTTAYDLFALYNIPIKYKDYSFGKLVEEINGLAAGVNDRYWIYYINGEAAQLGADSYQLNSGDQILWRFEEEKTGL